METWYRSTLAAKLNATDVTITVATAPTVTAWRMHVYSGSTHAWIKYTGVTGTTLTGVTFVSQTADPATTVTGTTFPAWTSIELVDMHDQKIDKQTGSKVKVYADTTARDADITSPENGMTCYSTADGVFFDYIAGAWSARATGSTSNASTTVAGKVELSTDAELRAGTATGGTGATIVPNPSQLLNFWLYGDGSDWDVTISINTTLTTDKYYNNLTVNTGVTLDPAWFAIYVLGTLTLTGTAKIIRNGNAGSAASGLTAGAGATALVIWTCGISLWGGTGGTGVSTGAGWAWVAWVSVNPSYATTGTVSIAGGTGGTGGTSAGAGWAAWTATQWARYNVILNIWKALALLASPGRIESPYWALPSAWGGGAWAGGSGWYGGGGGGGGGNGGTIFVYATTIAGSGTIESKGGAGWAGAAWQGTNCGGGGGGGGGSGWIVTLVYHTGTPYTITLTGGAGWAAGGAGGAWGGAWVAWATGTVWQSIVVNV